MATLTAATPASRPQSLDPHTRDRIFYSTMAVVIAVAVFGGFGPSYYWTYLNGGPTTTVSGGSFTTIVHLHAICFTAWVLLFVTQTTLVAAHRVAAHRRLGIVGGSLAGVMIVTGTAAAIAQARRGAAPPGVAVDPLAFLTIPLFDMVLFGGFIACALAWRRNRDAHKRLMLMAYVSVIAAAFGRMTILTALVPGFAFLAPFALVGAGMIFDRVTRRRIHPVYLWGGLVLLFSGLRVPLGNTAGWHAFAAWLVS